MDHSADLSVTSHSKPASIFVPDPKIWKNSHVPDYDALYASSVADPVAFWKKVGEELTFHKPPQKILDWNPKSFEGRWFAGAEGNITENALDRHVRNGFGNKVALIWAGDRGEEEIFTYSRLLDQTIRFAHILKSLGVGKGDRVSIFLPPTPFQVISMLACARIGAIHSVVFSGFSSNALRSRMEDFEPKVLITADCGYRRGKRIPLLATARTARAGLPSLETTVVVERDGSEPLEAGERSLESLLDKVRFSGPLDPVPVSCDDPLFVLYTSGTTGKPKGVVHVQLGYMVGVYITARWIFDLRDSDVYFCVADPGWITGHSYIIYGPLLNRATVLLSEGTPEFPDAGRHWSLIERHRVTIYYSTPTTIRLQMRFGDEWPARFDTSTLRILGSVGEPLNPEAWHWFHRVTGGTLPIMDTWWQTETGMIMITPLPSTPEKPGSAGRPFPGVVAEVVDPNGQALPPGQGGTVVVRSPWPSMFRTVFRDPERYKKYWTEIPGAFFSGDSAKRDEGGYFSFMGRVDDVIKVAGHRLGTAEIESALITHPKVAEAAAIGKPDELKGEIIKVFIVLHSHATETPPPHEEIRRHVRTELGGIAEPQEIDIVISLPKTRSGKIMRRVLKAREMGLPEGDLSTMED
jgi:acetyl-CoA synthetase